MIAPEQDWDAAEERRTRALTRLDIEEAMTTALRKQGPDFARVLIEELMSSVSENLGRSILKKVLWTVMWALIVITAYMKGKA